MRLNWPTLRFWRRFGMIAILGLILLIIAVRLFAMSPIASQIVTAQIERQTVRGQSLEVTGLRGDILGRVRAEQLTVRDAQGVWLRAEQVDLNWSPLSLLSGYLNVDWLTAETLELSRRPTLTPSTSSGDSALDRYRLDRFAIEQLRLAEGVIGPAQTYTLTSGFRMAGYQGRVDADLVPVSSIGDVLSARLDWGGAVPLRGELALTGAPSGLVATLLQAPGDQAVSAKLEASGTLKDWTLTGEAALGGSRVMELTAEDNRAAQRLSGWLSLEAFGALAPVARRLGQRVDIDAQLARDGAMTARLMAQVGTFELAGEYAQTRNGLRLEDMTFAGAEIDAARLTELPDLQIRAVRAKGNLTVEDGGYGFEGEVTAPDLSYGNYQGKTVASTGEIFFESGTLTGAIEVALESLDGLPDAVHSMVSGRLVARLDADLSLSQRLVTLRSIDLTGPAIRSRASGEIGFDGAVNLQGSSTVRALALLKTISGDWTLNGPDAQALTLRFDGALQPARLDSPLGEILGARAGLQAVLNRRGQEVIIDKVVLKSETVDAVMSGQLENGVIDLNTELAADPLRVAGVVADGLTVTARMAGPIDSPQTRVTLAGDRVEMSGQMLRQVQVMGDLAGLSQPTFQVAADAILADAPLTLSVGGQYVQNQVRADQVRVTWDELIAIGSGAVDLAQIEGSSLTLDFDGRAPIVGALSGQVGYQEQTLNASASVEKAVYGPIDLDQATFALTGAWPQFEGQLGFEAALPILGVETPTRGHFDLAVSALEPTIDVSGVSQVGAQEIRADAPIQIRFSDGMTAQGALSAFGGGIAFTYDASGVTPSEVTLSALSLSEFGPLLLRPSLRGTLEGAAQLQISEGGLSGSARATIFDLARGLPDTPSADLSLNAILVENRLNAEVRAKDADETLDLVADFATTLQHKGHLPSIRLADGARTPLRLIGGGPIAPLWGLAAPPDLRLDGDFNVDINNGVGDTFRFTGPLRFENGAFEDGFTGIYLKSIVVDAQLKQSGIDVRSATANGANNGSLSASGAYLFDGSGAVTLRLNRLDAFNRSDISATVSGDAQIDRQNRRTRILGDLTLDQARVNVANLSGSGYTTIEVEFSDQSDEDEDEGPTREAILLDLGIKADRRIFVSGLGVDSEWSADLRVSGSAGQPRLIGRANLVRGEADLLSRRFELSEGVLRFIGAPEETEVSLAAERTEDGITSAISLNGNVMDPEITLSSDPALPDDEILARVLFGRSPSQLSPLQAAQLAGAAAQLAGGDAINLMGRLEAATGLDRLDIGFDDDGAATLATGKYLADDIYLEVESGVSGAPGVALEWTPLDNLAVDAEIDPELGPKVAIQWKRDFDRLPFEDEAE